MPYPFEQPKNKHDLLSPEIPAEEDSTTSLKEKFGFSSSAALFEALRTNVNSKPTPLATVYTYPDAPAEPLGRGLFVIGVADVSLSVVRKLVDDEDEIPPCLHKCTVAVKRADGSYARHLREKDIANSHAFAKFLRRLRKEGLVAILGQDKLHRFGILKPTEDMALEGEFEGQDFATNCFVGRIEDVENYLAQGVAASQSEEVAKDPPAGSEFWAPPGSDSADAAFSWEPPSGNDADKPFEFGNGGANSWQAENSTSLGHKRPRENDEGDSSNEFHADSGAAAADVFYSGLTRSLDTRANSRLYHMRAFNGWVKATQIQELDPKTQQPGKAPLRVLDLACGKGGDLGKWVLHTRGISNYVGIDVARGSLKDAALRARKMRQKLGRCTFTCADLGADVPGRLKSPSHKHMQKLLTWSLQNEPLSTSSDPEFREVRGGGILREDKFDVVSIQFAIHYMMSTRRRARRFFRTVSELLEIGGNLIATTIDARVVLEHMMNLGLDLHFDDDSKEKQEALIKVGGGACRIAFSSNMVKRIFEHGKDKSSEDEGLFGLEYTFTLVEGTDHAAGVGDAVNLPEWLTPIPVLKSLAKEAGLEMEYAHNFHEYFDIRRDPSAHAGAHSSLYSMKVVNRQGSISKEEYEISRLYAALKFRKVQEPAPATEEDLVAEEKEEEDDEIDPMVKAKLLPMAMMKAKKIAGDDAWKSLSSDEKTRLTDVELHKLAKR